MKKILFAVLIFAAIVGGVVIAKNSIAKASIENAVRMVTGLPLQIGRLEVGVLRPRVIVNDLKLGNPPVFSDRVMANLHELYVDYDLAALLKKQVHLAELRIDLREFYIIKDKDGKLNLDALKPADSGNKKPAAAGNAQIPIRIDQLHLRLGRIVYRDYSRGSQPFVQEFALNLDETYQNVSDPKAIVPLIVGKALMNTTIGQLANLDPKELFSKYAVSSADLGKLGLDRFSALSAETLNKVSGIAASVPVNSVGKTAASAGSGVADTAKKAADELKKVLPF